jgi:hypothetical protein
MRIRIKAGKALSFELDNLRDAAGAASRSIIADDGSRLTKDGNRHSSAEERRQLFCRLLVAPAFCLIAPDYWIVIYGAPLWPVLRPGPTALELCACVDIGPLRS